MLLGLFTALTINYAADQTPREFYDYLKKPDRSYRVESLAPVRGSELFKLTSQTWQGQPWTHNLLFRQPEKLAAKGTAILFITGDGPKEGDFTLLQMVTQATGMPTAMLLNIPNQPLYGMKEDDLIAHTFEKYLETGDSSWPLLFPMAKSAIRAMDAIVEKTAHSKNPIKRFVVTGASKRGWTTWFVGASRDKRVVGIAPMVYDNLDINKQMKHQLDSWGAYSEQIQDYTRRGLQAKLESSANRLGIIVDPYSYKSQIHVPTLIITGANDPYWTVDSMSIYWDKLKQPHWCSVVPNAGHGLGSGLQAVGAVGAFARSLAGAFGMPSFNSDLEVLPSRTAGLGSLRVVSANLKFKGTLPTQVTVWTNTNSKTDFRNTKWVTSYQGAVANNQTSVHFGIPRDQPTAVLVESHYKIGGRDFVLDYPVKVLKP